MKHDDQALCDLLVISPHTDDLEIGLGGTVALLAKRGRKVWALDLTRGELGSNATVDERWGEAEAASGVLGLAGRAQLALPDGFIDARDREQLGPVVAMIRRLRPRWVATAPDPRRHPDHLETPALVARAVFLSRLEAWQPEPGSVRVWADGEDPSVAAPRWEPEAVLRVCRDRDQPSLLFDISSVWKLKLEALACYPSQFRRGEGRRATMINDAAFLEKIERRARNWGTLAGVDLAEALCTEAAPVLTDLPEQRWV